MICDWPNRPKQKVDHQVGKPSLTHYRLLSSDEQTSLLELTPITGRSHQLRVHMLTIGHPILGDRLYAHKDALKLSSRLQLHAQTLSISHPVTGKNTTFHLDAPFH